MAKRNQVTTDLRISADAQLKSSRSFISQLDKIIDKFDFGDKINNQLIGAKNQLKDYNKILEKVQNKSLISDEELKDLIKAGKEITNIVNRTEKLYANLDSSQLQKFSKEYINQVKATEEAVARIKNEYTAKTGKNFDKELANYDKLSAKVKALEQEKANLAKNGTTQIVTREIEQLNQKLEEQKNKLLEIKKVQADSSKVYSSTLDKESKKRGYDSFDDLKGIRGQSEEQIRKQLGNAEYKQQSNILTEINRQIKEIEKNKQEGNQADRAAVALAKKYKIENISTLQDLKEQVRLKKENLNQFKNNKSDLANEKLVSAEFERQNKILADREAIINAAKKAELTVIQKNSPYNSKASLTAGASATNRSVNNLESQLTDSGIEQITNNAANIVANEIAKLNTEITKGNQELAGIDETNKKLATQSERSADEQDVKDMKNSVNGNIQQTEKNVNQHTIDSNNKISQELRNLITPVTSTTDFTTLVEDYVSDVDYDTKQISNEYSNFFTSLNNDFKDFSVGKIDEKVIKEKLQKEKEVISAIIKEIEEGIEINHQALIEEMKSFQGSEQFKKVGYEQHQKAQEEYEKRLTENQSQKFKLNKIKETVNEDFGNVTKRLEYFEGENNIKSYSGEMSNLASATERAAEQSAYLGSTFDDIRNKIGYFLSLNYVFDQVTRKITEAINVTKEMDKDMTQIGLVLGKTSGQVWKNFGTYSSMAERLNTTTSQVTNSMKLFYQQGLNTSEVNKMVEASAIAAALGESTMAEASETLTSIINSYNLSANEAMMVTDKISQIAIVSAADFGELSTAIEKVASSAASAGLDLDHMMGYLAKMIETTREAPTNIGTALKTIVANFTQFKEDPTQLNVEGSEINKVDKALKSVGISLTDTQGEVRDLSDVLDELGGQWKNLTRSQKSYLATQIAGTRQQSRFYALMNDYDRTLELVEEGSNSAGKAQQQFALYSNSLEASANRLTNQWEKFFNSITKGNGLVANFNNTLTNLMKIVNMIGPLGTALGIGSLIKSTRQAITTFHNLNELVETRKERRRDFNQNINDIKSSDDEKDIKKEKTDKLQLNYNSAMKKDLEELTVSETKYLKKIEQINKAQKTLDFNFKSSSKALDKFKYTVGTTKNDLTKFWASLKLGASQAKTALASLAKQFTIMLAITAALKLVGTMAKGAKSAIGINTEAYVENAEKATENAENIEGLIGEYEELSKKINKTTEEQERLKEITQEVTKIDSKLGQQLKDNAGNYELNIKRMQEYADLQKKIAAQESSKAIRGEATKSRIPGLQLFDEDLWTSIIGSKSDKEALKSSQENQWRQLSTNRAQENNLTEAQSSMLDKYTENLIKSVNNWDGHKMKFNTGYFDEAIQNFIKNLDKLSEGQEKAYTEYLENFNSEDYNTLDLYKQLEELDVPEEIKQNLIEQWRGIFNGIKDQIDNNEFITDKDTALASASGFLSLKDASKLFNPDTSTMSKDDYRDYKESLANFIQDPQLVADYSNAQEKGAKELENFANKLSLSGKYSDVFTESLYTAAEALNSEQFQTAITNLLKIGELNSVDITQGTANQWSILNELGKGNLKIQDLIITDLGTISVNTSKLIAEQQKNIETIFNSLMNTITKQKTNIANIDSPTKNQHLKDTKEQMDRINSVRNLNNRENITYENGYDPTKTTYKSEQGSYIKQDIDVTKVKDETLKFNIDQLDRRRGLTPGYQTTETERVMRSEYAKRTVDTGIQDTSNMDDTGKIDYLIKQNNALEEAKGKLKDLNQDSQDYYNTTYKIYSIQEDLKGVIEKEPGILDRIENKAQETEQAYDNQVAAAKNVKEELNKQYTAQKKSLEKVKKRLSENLNYQKGFAGFFDGLTIDNTLTQSIDAIKTAYQQLNEEIVNTDDLQQTLAANPALIQALDVTAEGLTWNKQKLEELGIAALDESYNYIQSRIEDMEATKATLEAESDDINNWSDNAVTQVSAVIGGNNSLVNTQQQNAQAEATNLGISEQTWITWSDSVCEAIMNAGKAYSEFLNAQKEEREFNYDKKELTKKVGSGGGGKGAANVEDKKNDIKKTLKATGYGANKQGAIDNINKQIQLLKGLQNSQKYKKSNIGKYLGGDLYGDGKKGGSKDKLDPMIEKLEHFYNYLRKIEKLESKLNKLAEERNLIDANNNYYIDDLKEENELLNEQQKLYTSYIADEEIYLKELQGLLKGGAYGDKVRFDEDGLIQLDQTEFTAETEEEQEKLKGFLELVQEYQDEYNTKLENQNKLIQTQVQQLENVKKMYDKILQRISDVTEEIERQIGLTEHNQTMEFSEIEQIDLSFFKAGQNVEGIQYTSKEIAKLNKEIASINKTVKNLPYSELLEWDEELQQWGVNEEKMKDPAIKKKYEEMGYTWSDIETSVRSITTQSQSLNKSLKETVEKSNSFRENLKQILDDIISGITDFFSRSTDMINQYFHQIERGMDDIDNQNDLFGVNSESLENKYKTLVQSVVIMKQLNTALQEERKKTEKELTKSYGAYVTFVNGVAVMNEQAVDNSTKLTEEQKAELKTLIAAYNSATDQIEGLEDKQLEYFQKMMEMEEAKRDAIIELKQQVHDELMARDQEEIDNLRSKYEKMNQLDQEYYSELQQRVSDARDLRDRRQESNNIGQMQARLAVLKADNSGTYNSELIELQKQLNQALQTQADNDVNRELERIQREQKQREEDRALTISAMENVLTFKDENNWYWQEADRIWREGQQSVAGFLMTSNEYLNISNEQRAQQFGALTDNMNTAFTNLSQKAGETMSVSTGIVKNATDAVKSSIDYVQGQLGSGENGVIYSSITSNGDKISEGTTSITAAVSATPGDFQAKMRDLYNSQIGKDVQSGAKAIEKYLGKDSTLLTKTNSIIDQINTVDGKIKDKIGTTNTFLSTGFSNLHDALLGQNNSVSANIKSYLDTYLGQNSTIWKYLSKKYADEYGKKETQNTKPTTTPNVAKPNNNNQSKNDNNTPKPGGGNGTPEVGDVVTYIGGTYYSSSDGGTPVGKRGPGKKVTITRIVPNAAYPIHVKSSDSAYGWLKKSQISGYRKGGYVDYTGVAEVHGSRKDPEAFLNVKQTRLFEELRDSLVRKNVNSVYDKDPVEISKEEYNIDKINIEVKQIADVDAVEKVTKKVKEEIYKDAVGNNNMAVRRR